MLRSQNVSQFKFPGKILPAIERNICEERKVKQASDESNQDSLPKRLSEASNQKLIVHTRLGQNTIKSKIIFFDDVNYNPHSSLMFSA